MISQQNTTSVVAKKNNEIAGRTPFEFLAYISHDLRSPMHGLLGFVQLCLKMVDKGPIIEEKLYRYLQTVENTSNQLLTLLADLQEFSEYQCDPNFCQLLDHDLKEVIEATFLEMQDLLDEKQLTLKQQFINEPLSVQFDYEKMKFVFHHLLKQVIQSYPEGREIVVECAQRKIPHDEIVQSVIEIMIKAQWFYVSEEDLATLFDPFTQSHQEADGSRGLKWAICAEIIKAHQGKIWAEKDPQGGSRLIIYLPGEI